MQLSILLFFQRIGNPLLDIIMECFTMLGEIAVPLIVLLILSWCVSRKKAVAVALSLLSALLVSQTLKAIFRIPRPFQVYSELIDARRVETATGYSFPSGHSTTSGSFYASIAACFRKWWILLISLIAIIMVPVSRMYLGVHWPLDTLIGTAIGVIIAIGMTAFTSRLYDNRRAYLIFTFTYGLIAFLAALILTLLLVFTEIDSMAFSDLASNASIAAGAIFGFYLDRKTISSDPAKGRPGLKAIRFAVGIAILIPVALGVNAIPLPHAASENLLFLIIGLYSTYLYPLLAVSIGLMGRDVRSV